MADSVAQTIPEHYRRAFADNFEHVVQQRTQKLGNRVRVDQFSGKEKVYQDIEELEFRRRQGRLTQSTPTQITAHNRKLSKLEFNCQVIFDRLDDEFLGSLGRPDSETMEAMRMAFDRTVDEQVAIAASDTVYGGAEPYTTAITLPASQAVAVNYVKAGATPANSGLTPQKIIRAAAILEENEVDPNEEECCLVINPKGKQDLMSYVESSPNEVWARMITAWLEGKDSKLFGFTPIVSNRLVTNTSTDVDTAFAYSKSRGIVVAPGALQTHIDIRPDLNHAVQISAYGLWGFMRRYEKSVVTIACDRTP